jgi:hypothetical protein
LAFCATSSIPIAVGLWDEVAAGLDLRQMPSASPRTPRTAGRLAAVRHSQRLSRSRHEDKPGDVPPVFGQRFRGMIDNRDSAVTAILFNNAAV